VRCYTEDAKIARIISWFELTYLPPITSILETNKGWLKSDDSIHVLIRALSTEAIKIFEEITKKVKEKEKEKDIALTVAMLVSIGRRFNEALGLGYPKVICVLYIRGGDQSTLAIATLDRGQIAGMHDCLRADVVPIIEVESGDKNEGGEINYKKAKTTIIPILAEEPEEPT